MTQPIKVLVIDDSLVIQKMLSELLAKDHEFAVAGCASDPFEARSLIFRTKPDVLILDLNMPKMDGITFLRNLMENYPIPTVVLSSLTARNSKEYLAARKVGAADVIQKPQLARILDESFSLQIKSSLRNACRPAPAGVDRPLSQSAGGFARKSSSNIIAIGSSTGGTQALMVLLSALPENPPPIVIVQHMPARFTPAFAQRLNQSCRFRVKEASEGDTLEPATALLAPGNFHLRLMTKGSATSVVLNSAPLLHGVRPAVDYAFEDVASIYGKSAIGIILTGMGKDGAIGLGQIREAGGYTISQDEKTSVVYGMPKAAVAAGASMEVLPLQNIAARIVEVANRAA